jgi:hypothetical protein
MDIIIVITVFICLMSAIASIFEDSNDTHQGHHDSRPGSHYEICNRK